MKMLTFLLACLSVTAIAAPTWQEQTALRDSLSRVHPRLRSRWLAERGVRMPGENAPLPVSRDSVGLRLVGKFGRGPAFEVTGRDSLAFLCLGSEVAVLRLADTGLPVVVCEIQADGLVRKAAVRDSLLYFSAMWGGSPGVDIWNVENPSAPVRRGHIPTLLQDFCVRDTFLYVTQALDGVADTFKVYSIADPARPYLLGSCRDSGDAVTVTNGAAFLADRWGLYVVDVSDPRNPHRIGSYPGMPISVEARNTICCVTFGNPNQPDWLEFDILSVSNPSSPQRLGYLSNTGGYDIFLEDSFAYLSGYYTGGHEFKILSVADSARPRLIGTCGVPGDKFGVWPDLERRRAFVASDLRGLGLVNISDLTAPAWDTSLFVAGLSKDVSVQGDLAFVASNGCGMLVLDIGDPTAPTQPGSVESTTTVGTQTVAVQDSFAYMGYFPSLGDLHSIDVSDPAHPRRAGGVNLFNQPEDIVLRDTFAFVAEDGRLQVINVARPRQPVLVGSCNIGVATDLTLADTIAFASRNIVNVANPASPAPIGTLGLGGNGCAVRDTFLFWPATYDSFLVYSIANPASPRKLASIRFSEGHVWNAGVALVDSLVFVGGDFVHVVDVSDPANPREVGSWTSPLWVRRLCYSEPCLFASCSDAGVCILETTATGVTESRLDGVPTAGLRLLPNPARTVVTARMPSPSGEKATWRLLDVAGRCARFGVDAGCAASVSIALAGLRPGVYCLELTKGRQSHRGKFVKN